MRNNKGIIEPVSAAAIAGMAIMMAACIGLAVWGMPKMMGMMHGDHDKKSHEAADAQGHDAHATRAVDPVCGMEVEIKEETPRTTHQGKTYYFCSADDLKRFADDPARFLGKDSD